MCGVWPPLAQAAPAALPSLGNATVSTGAASAPAVPRELVTITTDVVKVAGRVMSYRNSGMFIDLRDSTGVCQVVIRDEDVARTLRPESCVRVSGDVEIRPEGNDNAEISTGAIEVMSDVVEVLS